MSASERSELLISLCLECLQSSDVNISPCLEYYSKMHLIWIAPSVSNDFSEVQKCMLQTDLHESDVGWLILLDLLFTV